MGVTITRTCDFKGGSPEFLVSWEPNHIINLLPRASIFLKPVPGWYQHLHFVPTEWLKIQAQAAENSRFESDLSFFWIFSNFTDPSPSISVPLEAVMCGLYKSGTPLPSGCWLDLTSRGYWWGLGQDGWERVWVFIPRLSPRGPRVCSSSFPWWKPSPLPEPSLGSDLMVRTLY